MKTPVHLGIALVRAGLCSTRCSRRGTGTLGLLTLLANWGRVRRKKASMHQQRAAASPRAASRKRPSSSIAIDTVALAPPGDCFVTSPAIRTFFHCLGGRSVF